MPMRKSEPYFKKKHKVKNVYKTIKN